MLNVKLMSTCISVLLSLAVAEAKVVQILHTNDTHSFLNNSGHEVEVGGSSRLKSLIDFYKERATRDGIQTVTLDGGDFLEGNVYYMADQGLKSFEVHNQIGYDAVVLGNHDYLMGAKRLDEILGTLDLNFSFLGANVTSSPKYPNIRDKLKPYKEIDLDGLKIAIIGLTTNDLLFSWSLEGSKISSPVKVAQDYEKVLKKRNNDFIFALTHIGVNGDIKLAAQTSHIDLIVGGHSHSALSKPVYEENKRKISVPIVQAGFHTIYLGRVMVNMERGKPLEVISYELVPVKYLAEDQSIKTLVEEADNNLEEIYGKDWLDEKIGHSILKPKDRSGSKKWAFFIADTLKEKVAADVSIHVSSMNGENYPVGPISRRDIINSIPRVFELHETYGWSIYTAKVSGALLKIVCESLAYFGEPLTFSGITLDWTKTPLGMRIVTATINGKKINPNKYYKVAFTEGIIRGADGISPKTKIILRNAQKTEYKIWQTLEERIASDSSSFTTTTANEPEHSFYFPE